MRRRALVTAVAIVAAAAVLVGVGRWEQHRAARTEMTGMRSVLAAIGGDIGSKRLSGYRYGPPNCLAYHDRTMLLALQLCFDSEAVSSSRSTGARTSRATRASSTSLP